MDDSLTLHPTTWTSVNRWECDENDHLNVRFYAAKMNDALRLALDDLGIRDGHIRSQHMRYLAEARVATPLRIDAAPVVNADGQPEMLTVMTNIAFDRLLATYTTRLDESTRLPAGGNLPAIAAPRGLIEPPQPVESSRASAAGYLTVGRGVIHAHECRSDATLEYAAYVGRISDGMPNLWSQINPPRDAAAHERGEQGGAVLEYRLDLHAPLCCGDAFTNLSGIVDIGNKTMTLSHLLINESSGECAASAQALTIAMDLQTRRSAPISESRRARMAQLLISPDSQF